MALSPGEPGRSQGAYLARCLLASPWLPSLSASNGLCYTVCYRTGSPGEPQALQPVSLRVKTGEATQARQQGRTPQEHPWEKPGGSPLAFQWEGVRALLQAVLHVGGAKGEGCGGERRAFVL